MEITTGYHAHGARVAARLSSLGRGVELYEFCYFLTAGVATQGAVSSKPAQRPAASTTSASYARRPAASAPTRNNRRDEPEELDSDDEARLCAPNPVRVAQCAVRGDRAQIRNVYI